MPHFDIRPAAFADHAVFSALLSRSYLRLLAPCYSSTVLAGALPVMTLATPETLGTGRYFLAEQSECILAVGGWSDISPFGRACPDGHAHIRHLACDPERLRQGIGRGIVARLVRSAQTSGIRVLHCLSPHNAAPFYAATGFEALGEVAMRLTPELDLPVIHMRYRLA
ncbi:Acetyltransferase, GNAT family [Roseovarius lutimaris]|uniref:Acetyltransferase, GNAT family n=1 Tax=Roseovarius lutimaris TaxID=1005928 RepID=A0A1I5DNX2_9RHOB|nr:GNAT family N-acetyltransferase [Roseovarius lutimaris]SFO00800.1 Acetyltransferase, GNAT family [Roseovarius lutimaris]